MFIVGICGSPRKKATEYVLDKSLEDLKEQGFETEMFTVRGKEINPCRHCDYCLKKKECVMKDDMFDVYDLLRKADGIILASPMYNGSISSQIKAVMDRCRALGAEDINLLKGKIGMSIAVGGDRAGGQELAIQQINTYYILSGIIPVSGGPFGANLGATLWSQDTLEGVKKDEYGFKTLNKTLKRFVEFLNNYRQ
ncbi:multimeric flavodoxin [Methanobrevibacter arboriphilus JCM 13429 = DSM 1125]|uniref:Multimeric flavodoxin n=1 Tax=Methanobrevibacter arboriphilus JCM 13429 = DSM 1125 TaxID=1300164 RepID=A0A1V6N1I4_METAZ|nr:flavodoxin family protein [Methanobrevibacter arboriphilus]OQD58558.1 multimeric flavodoxin [Methanobrevibacter arboriphilus JCM 13429 = DSM 1125]